MAYVKSFLIIFGDVICIMLNFEELSHKLFSLVIFRNPVSYTHLTLPTTERV